MRYTTKRDTKLKRKNKPTQICTWSIVLMRTDDAIWNCFWLLCLLWRQHLVDRSHCDVLNSILNFTDRSVRPITFHQKGIRTPYLGNNRYIHTGGRTWFQGDSEQGCIEGHFDRHYLVRSSHFVSLIPHGTQDSYKASEMRSSWF